MDLLALAYVLGPAYFANMAAAFAKFWPGWNRPISRRWLGDHKTVVGCLFGVTTAAAVSWLQTVIAWTPAGLTSRQSVALGVAQGIGAMSGDAVKSFFKRRVGIPPGQRWIPADQIDFVIGAIAFGWPWLALRLSDIAMILAFTVVAHIATNHVAFRLKLRDTSW
jgi:CDP-2,3-bis-(O-geranylgeranyl)-sn-glycerol synthase